ncbi:NTP/NDP exchange transporter [Pseudomonadota bacterium]
MEPRTKGRQPPEPGWLDRSMRLFGDVHAGEGVNILLMFLNVYFLLMAYYILKTVREPLILTGGGAELKSYAAAFQAVVLIAYVPLYGWLASRLPRQKLIVAVVLFFTGCIQVFAAAVAMGLPYIGFTFFVWLGIFSVSVIAQFWSYANDIYSQSDGKRLFPLIAVGSTAGAPIGAAVAGWLYNAGVGSYWMMQLASALLLVHLALYILINRRAISRDVEREKAKPLSDGNGFALVFRNRYLLLIGGLLVLLNIVNTTGEYILGRSVLDYAGELAARSAEFDTEAFIGGFYGSFFFWVNIATVVIQAFFVSRLVKYLGMAGALFALPIIALGTYSLVAMGAGFAILRITKLAENATDYSVMNTVKQMLWLPTTRAEKYKAKQAIDTFFVRAGDVVSGLLVFAGTQWLALDVIGFGKANVLFVVLWIVLAALLFKKYKDVTDQENGILQR